MESIEEVIRKIEELRHLMYEFMNEKFLLTDPELVVLSQQLDNLLNKYNELVNKKF